MIEALTIGLEARNVFRVRSTTDPRVLDECLDEELDVVLTDVRMPEVDGMSVLARVRERIPGVEVILMTAYSSIARAVEAIKVGAFDYVPKPFDADWDGDNDAFDQSAFNANLLAAGTSVIVPNRAFSPTRNPYTYTARRLDPESMNMHYRYRTYSPTLRQFMQRDPLGYVDGPSPYQYVRGNPGRYVDPFGLHDDFDNFDEIDEELARRKKQYSDAGNFADHGTIWSNFLLEVSLELGIAVTGMYIEEGLIIVVANGFKYIVGAVRAGRIISKLGRGHRRRGMISFGKGKKAKSRYGRKRRRVGAPPKRGGSGRPVAPTVKHPTRKKSKDGAAAESAKGRAPVHEVGPHGGHYHGVDCKGNRLPTHHDQP
ncbi:MAG: response regulator [Candidatus Krumholzibacteriia bacterium]